MSLDLTGIGSVADLIKDGIDKIFPDKSAAAALKAQVDQANNANQLAEMQANLNAAVQQVAVDNEEAKNASVFVAGWRPFIGWVCGSAFAYNFVLQPFVILVLKASGSAFNVASLPVLDIGSMMPVLLGMLGLGYMRTQEKIAGVSPKGAK